MAQTSTAAKYIPLSAPEIRGNEWAYVKDCLDTCWVSSVGEYVNRFERSIAEKLGAPFAVATSSGTSALHIALLVSGVQPDDEVLVSTLTFIAPVNAIRYVGAWPVLIDAEAQYWQVDPGRVAAFLQHNCEYRNGEVRNRKSSFGGSSRSGPRISIFRRRSTRPPIGSCPNPCFRGSRPRRPPWLGIRAVTNFKRRPCSKP